jgi:hypothetical protein
MSSLTTSFKMNYYLPMGLNSNKKFNENVIEMYSTSCRIKPDEITIIGSL